MSYSQILRRINRLLKSTINDVVDNLGGNDQELNDFDDELRREQQRQSGSSSGEGRSRGTGWNSTSGRAGSRGGNSSRDKNSSSGQGKRKPGEKDDAFYYAVLGLTPSATIPEIRKAYRKMMSQYHPDRVATLGVELRKVASDKAKEINEAYSIIERRREFN